MNFSRIFIDKPIFAAVLSIIIFVAGLLAIFKLPVSEYPDVVPPSVVVRAQYPGANPKVIAAVMAALAEAMQMIKTEPKKAIEIYLTQVKEKVTAEELVAILGEPGVVFDVAPVGMQKFATFMAKAGTIKTAPASWKDFFFVEAHTLAGN